MTVTTIIKVDLLRQNVIPVIWAKSGDLNSRFLKIIVTENGVPRDIPTDATVTLGIIRSDGAAKSFAGSVNLDGSATILLSEWALVVNGFANCSLTIVEGNSVLTTLSFQLYIQESEYNISGSIVYYLTGGTLNPGTYTLYIGNLPYTFATSEVMPSGAVIVFNSANTAATIYQTINLQAIIESGITVTQENSGIILPGGDLYNRMLSSINGFSADLNSESAARIAGDNLLHEEIQNNKFYLHMVAVQDQTYGHGVFSFSVISKSATPITTLTGVNALITATEFSWEEEYRIFRIYNGSFQRFVYNSEDPWTSGSWENYELYWGDFDMRVIDSVAEII